MVLPNARRVQPFARREKEAPRILSLAPVRHGGPPI